MGLLIDSFTQRKWIYKVIQDIQASGIAEVSLVIKNTAETPPKSRWKSYWNNRNYLLYAFYSKLDNARVKVTPDAFESIDITPLVSDCPVIEVEPVMTRYTDRFPPDAINQIRTFELDVVLCFGFRILKG